METIDFWWIECTVCFLFCVLYCDHDFDVYEFDKIVDFVKIVEFRKLTVVAQYIYHIL